MFISIPCHTQNWEPEWSLTQSQSNDYTWTGILNVDFENNIYTTTPYRDILYLKDTILINENASYFQNWAIIKQDDQGNTLSVVDLAPASYRLISEVVLTTDKDLNMYIACEFIKSVTILDTTIMEGFMSQDWISEVLIAKINPDLKLEWTKVITSPASDKCHNIGFSDDGYLYLTIDHVKIGTSTDTIDYFGQDTALFLHSMSSVLKMNVDGNIVWRKELVGSGAQIEINGLLMKDPDNLLIHGYTTGELYYSDNTLFHPDPAQGDQRPFIIDINSTGDFISGTIPDWPVTFLGVEVDSHENFYFICSVRDTLFLGNDTVIQYPDTTKYVIAKTDSNLQPLWHETFVTILDYSTNSYIKLCNDTLIIAAGSDLTIELFDTIFETDFYKQTIVGQITPDGILNNHTTLKSNLGLKSQGLYIDNCHNLIVSGNFIGEAIIGNDTLQTLEPEVWDGLIVKISRNLQQRYDLGNDTIVCENIELKAPEGYEYYRWNDSITESNSYMVTKSGEYKLEFANDDGCWIRDAIYIIVDPTFNISIGQDTAISLSDTLFLSIPDQYDSYLWWNGSIESSTFITGEEAGSGTWVVWVDVTQGACTVSDSIEVVVNSIPHLRDIGVSVYPNPVSDELNIISNEKYNMIELLNLNGKVLLTNHHYNQQTKLNMSDLSKGVYLIRIYMDDFVGVGKIVKR